MFVLVEVIKTDIDPGLLTVDLKTLETIERLFGKPASSKRHMTGINRRDKKLKYNSAAI